MEYYWGKPVVTAAEFITNNQASAIMERLNSDSEVSENEKKIIFQFVADFSNWSHFADKYIAHYIQQVIL